MVPVVSKDSASYISTPPNRYFVANRYMRLRENLNGQTWEISAGSNGMVVPRSGSTDGYEQLAAPVNDSTVGSHGFRSWYGWGAKGELMEAGGSRYMLSTVLGVTEAVTVEIRCGKFCAIWNRARKPTAPRRRARFTLWIVAISARQLARRVFTWRWSN